MENKPAERTVRRPKRKIRGWVAWMFFIPILFLTDISTDIWAGSKNSSLSSWVAFGLTLLLHSFLNSISPESDDDDPEDFKVSKLTIFGLAFIIFPLVYLNITFDDERYSKHVEEIRKSEIRKAERAAQEEEEAKLDKVLQSAVAAILEGARSPKSMKIIAAKRSSDGGSGCLVVSGLNAFGVEIVNRIEFSSDPLNIGYVDSFRFDCDSLVDRTYRMNYLLEYIKDRKFN